VAAEHHDDAARISFCRRDRGHDTEKIAGDENIGQGLEERAEAPVLAGRRRKLFGVDLVWATLNRDGANFGEIGFRDSSRGSGGLAALAAYLLGDGK
jgi:hypothetical protein